MEKFLMIAGHGGAPYDPGATGNGYEEANLTRDLAEENRPIFQDSRIGYYAVRYQPEYGAGIS